MVFSPCYVTPDDPYAWVEPVVIESVWDAPLFVCCSSNLPKQVWVASFVSYLWCTYDGEVG